MYVGRDHLSPLVLKVGTDGPWPWVVWILHSLESGLTKTRGGEAELETSARISVSKRGRDGEGFS